MDKEKQAEETKDSSKEDRPTHRQPSLLRRSAQRESHDEREPEQNERPMTRSEPPSFQRTSSVWPTESALFTSSPALQELPHSRLQLEEESTFEKRKDAEDPATTTMSSRGLVPPLLRRSDQVESRKAGGSDLMRHTSMHEYDQEVVKQPLSHSKPPMLYRTSSPWQSDKGPSTSGSSRNSPPWRHEQEQDENPLSSDKGTSGIQRQPVLLEGFTPPLLVSRGTPPLVRQTRSLTIDEASESKEFPEKATFPTPKKSSTPALPVSDATWEQSSSETWSGKRAFQESPEDEIATKEVAIQGESEKKKKKPEAKVSQEEQEMKDFSELLQQLVSYKAPEKLRVWNAREVYQFDRLLTPKEAGVLQAKVATLRTSFGETKDKFLAKAVEHLVMFYEESQKPQSGRFTQADMDMFNEQLTRAKHLESLLIQAKWSRECVKDLCRRVLAELASNST